MLIHVDVYVRMGKTEDDIREEGSEYRIYRRPVV